MNSGYGGRGSSLSSRYEHGQKYMENLTQRSKKLSADTRNNLNALPALYAKVDELNRKLASSRLLNNNPTQDSIENDTHQDIDVYSSSSTSRRSSSINSSRREEDNICLREHKKALLKKTMVVSRFLDKDIKKRLEDLKYSNSMTDDPIESARRYSMIDLEYSEKRLKKHELANERLNENENNRNNDEDDVHSNSTETNDELFQSSTMDSNEFVINNSKDESNNINGVASRHLSKSRMSEFACNLSHEGQYALLKSLEDSLLTEIENNRPDLVDKIPLVGRAEVPTRRKSYNNVDHTENKRNSIVMQQIETIMELLDELRDNGAFGEQEKTKQTTMAKKKSSSSMIVPQSQPSAIKKQIHFSDSSESYNENTSNRKPSTFNRRMSQLHRKSLVSESVSSTSSSSSSTTSDKLAHLIARYSYLKRHLD